MAAVIARVSCWGGRCDEFEPPRIFSSQLYEGSTENEVAVSAGRHTRLVLSMEARK